MSRKQKKTLGRILLSAALLIAAWIAPIDGSWKLIAFMVPYLVVGYDVLWSAIRNILHGQIFDEQFLMAIATLGAFGVGEYPEAVAVMLFYQIGELFQSIAVGRSRRSIAALMDIRPDTATVLRDGQETVVSPEEVALGELILVKPGEKIPLDGEIMEGTTSVNTAALTGESLPVDRTVGENVVSGSVNLTGVITVRVHSVFAESTVSKILTLMEESAAKKAKVEGFITRFARVYTPCVVTGAALLALLPPLLFGGLWSEWLERALVFLVVSCPCALVVSVPLSFFGGIGGASKQGILVKGSNYMELLSKVSVAVFDKTGTLTKGEFKVSDIHPSVVDERTLLDIAAAVESFSSHPIAASIVRAHNGHIDKSRVSDVKELAGLGLSAVIDGQTVCVGNGKLMDSVHAKWHECHLPGTAVHIARNGEYLGHVIINDVVKPEAKEALTRLKALGVDKTVMLTGDRIDVAKAVQAEVCVDEVKAQLMPDQKVTAVEELLDPKATVAFIGDGINDAPVLSRADLGVAMGAMGSDAAIEAADIVLMDDKLTKLADAISIARKTMRIVKQNITFALAVKAVVLALGAMGFANMWIAVFADVGVLILAILNAMRALSLSKK
ncbi:MAG: heavy metal translocating P-type ATPase [Eubacteriales bacterium]|nr:heavy metal translocating P-type ATPase [Eubacteriales bacterium]